MTDRLAELGALQYAVENLSTAGTNPNRLGLAGYIHAAYTDYQAWAAANPGVNPNRLSAKGRLYGYFYDHASWSPLSLFASSEVGAWYDPSDLTTMFQDRAGTTPVTADGQTVGLILDKSKGLVLGANIVTNGGFATDVSGWVNQFTGTTTWDNGTLKTTSSGTNAGACAQAITCVVGKSYKVTGDIIYNNSSTGRIGADVQAYIVNGKTTGYKDVTGTYSCIFTASQTTMYICCDNGSGAAGLYCNFDNISVKELTGNHATAPSDAARPLKTSTGLSKWINYDAVDDVLNSMFPSSLGSSCTVCRANVGAAPTILTGQTIGTSYADSTDNAGLIIINRALTAQETTDVTAWLTAKGAT